MADTVEAAALAAKFERFMQRLTPPETADHYRDFVRWLEDLIGADAQMAQRYPQVDPTAAISLNIIDRVGAVAATAPRDLSALQSLKEVLRGLVWAEQAIAADEVISFAQFFADLVGAIEATSYTSSVEAADKSILVANVVQARGLSFQAVAVLGLAEGEFPANLSEDPLLWNADRRQLQSRGLRLDLPTDSAEVEFFYETITRPWGQLLLTRPRLADNGAPWKESPFWEEVTTLVAVEPVTLTHDNAPSPDRVASWPELMESLTTHPGCQPVWDWVKQSNPEREVALNVASQILDIRHSRATGSLFDGSLAQLTQQFQQQFAPDKIWSASRLENYRTCPFMFFAGSVLRLEAKEEPSEGLDARQLGNIYHLILEKAYQAVADPNNLADLLENLPTVAEPILDAAPHKEGFRETAWWVHTRQEIVANIRASLVQLAEHADNFTPVGYEQRFFEPDHHLTVQDGDDTFQLHGYIDRIDRATDGSIRIIDYKTGGPSAFTNKAVQTGKKLQLALYALAARDALQLGQPVDGFYWHVQHAEPSPVTLRKFKTETNSGPEAATRIAVEKAWEAVRGARAGHFVPQPPDEGCPSYCPAATFCWHYQPGFGG